MRAGKLARSVLTMQELAEGATSYGVAALEWASTAHTFRASIVQNTGTPEEIAAGLQEEAEYEIRVRHNPALTTRNRLYRDATGQVFEIIRIRMERERKHEMVLTCREIV